MPVKKAILPPGMQKALICLLPIRLTSHFHLRGALVPLRARTGMIRAAMARRRCSCGLPSRRQRALGLAPAPSAGRTAARRPVRALGRHQVARQRGLADVDLRQRRRGRGSARRQQEGAAALPGAGAGSRRAGTCGNNKSSPKALHVMSAPPARPKPPPLPCPGATRCKVYLEPATLRMLFAGLLRRPAAAAGAGHAELPAARGRHRPHHHRLPELGRPGLRLQVGLGAAGRPAADPAADHAARAPPRLAAAGAGDGDRAGSWAWPSTTRAPALRAAGLVRAAGGVRLGHAGHRARRLPHRIGRHAQAGRAGGGLPDRLPARDDLGRRRRAVDRGLGRSRRRRAATRTAPGKPPTW